MENKLSIFIPVFNGEKYIKEALLSLQRQEEYIAKVIVVDNCSTDSTIEIVREFRWNKLQIVINESNLGALGNHNKCIEMCDTSYLKIMSADDVLLPGIIKEQLNILEQHSSVAIVGCNGIITDDKLNKTGEINYESGYWVGRDLIKKCVEKVSNQIGCPTSTMLRVESLNSVRFDESCKWTADMKMWCSILKTSDFMNIDRHGFLYRRHEGTDTLMNCSAKVQSSDYRKFLVEYKAGIFSWIRFLIRYYVKKI